MTDDDTRDLPFLMAALKEAQDTVRAYDTKAQIVGVGYIFSINIFTGVGAKISGDMSMDLLVVVVSWILFVIPIVLFGAVLFPTRKVAPHLANPGPELQRTFYVEHERHGSVDEYLAAQEKADPRREVAYELLKTSGLRDLKRQRFLRALWAAVISFAILFLGQSWRAGF